MRLKIVAIQESRPDPRELLTNGTTQKSRSGSKRRYYIFKIEETVTTTSFAKSTASCAIFLL